MNTIYHNRDFHNQRVLLLNIARAAGKAGYHHAADILFNLLDPNRAAQLTEELDDVLRHIELGDHARAKRLLTNRAVNRFDHLCDALEDRAPDLDPETGPGRQSAIPDDRIRLLSKVVHLLFPVRTGNLTNHSSLLN